MPAASTRDDDGNGFCEVHVDTIDGFGSLLRSRLRPHRGEKLAVYLGFFQFVHNARRRGSPARRPRRRTGDLTPLSPPRNPGRAYRNWRDRLMPWRNGEKAALPIWPRQRPVGKLSNNM